MGPRLRIAVAFYPGHEGEESRRLDRGQEFRARLLPWARGCRFPTVGPRLRIAVALYRGHEGEDPRRLLPWAGGRTFPSPFTGGTRLMVPGRLTVVARPEIPVRHGARRE